MVDEIVQSKEEGEYQKCTEYRRRSEEARRVKEFVDGSSHFSHKSSIQLRI